MTKTPEELTAEWKAGKLEADKALKEYADKKTWDCCYRNQCAYVDGYMAQQALKEIEQ